MTLRGWIADFLETGAELWAEDGRLCFRAPEGVMTEAVRRELAAKKDAILDVLGDRRRHALASLAQQRLWLIEQLAPGTSVYNVNIPLRLRGPLDGAVLAECLRSTVERHESLRTVMTVFEGRPFQVVEGRSYCPLRVADLSGLTAGEREPVATDLMARESHRLFDLSHGPLFRATLVRLAPDEHLLLFTQHHAVTDGWSIVLMQRELWALYNAAARDEPASLPALPIQYTDFARWQHDELSATKLEPHLAYWKDRLASLPVLELPLDRPRPAVRTYRGAALFRPLPASAVAALQDFGRAHEASQFMTLLAAFLALLRRWTGQTDVAVGTFNAGRQYEEVELLIGFFINTLVLRGDLEGDPTFPELLRRVRQVVLEADEHQRLPFEHLVAELEPERDLSRHPLFQATFGHFEALIAEEEPRGMEVELYEIDAHVARFDLNGYLTRHRGELYFLLQYSTELFDATTIHRLFEMYHRLLEDIAEHPRRRIGQLDVLGAAQRHQVLLEWNAAPFLEEDARDLYQLFAEQAGRVGAAPAVVFEGGELSYQDLARRSRRLAGHLCRRGVGPEVVVGVYLERSPELAVAFLGVLAAGGAALLLDVDDPGERLAFRLEDARVPIVVTQRRLRERLPETEARVVLVEETPCEDISAPRILPDHPAYMIYTSGSTGRPKGVVNTHRAIVHHLRWLRQAYPLGPSDRMLHKAPPSFDVAVWELLYPLLSGAALVMARPGGHRDSRYLAELIAAREVTAAQFVPSMLRVFLDDERARGCRSLRQVVSGGEALTPDLVRRFAAVLPRSRLYNFYGPAEAAIEVATRPCRRGGIGARVPIGRPAAGTALHVLDGRLRPVGVGAPGELCIRGVQLARGYAGRPGRTARQFVPDPVSGAAGGRLYRTGDRARYLADGEIEFLGRMDRQVKLRGQRIELGEVEAVLARHPAVREAAVLACELSLGQPVLVGYPVGDGLEADRIGELHAFLRERLPESMVPARLVSLAELPRTPSGKVDRNALPRPEAGEGFSRTAFVAPRNPDEEILAGIWSRVLRVGEVAVHDHFFRLGGHSLLATQVTSRIEQLLRVEVPLRLLFENPTLEELAAAVASLRRESGPVLPPLVPCTAGEESLPLSFAQQRLWFLDQLQPLSPAYNMPASYRLTGELGTAALVAALREIVRRHAALRTRFVRHEGETRQVISEEASLEVPCVDLGGVPAPRRWSVARAWLAREAARPFDLEQGPLVRFLLLRLDEGEHALSMNMSHIVSDGWSHGVFLHELTALYEAFRRRAPSPLPELSVQYADFAVWQRRHLTREALEGHLDYWRRQLAGVATLELPTDAARPAVQTHRGAYRLLRLPADLHAALRERSLESGATLYMTSLAVFLTLLGRTAAQRDVVVGSPIAHRNREEVEGLIGFFVNSLVLRGDLAGNPTFLELLDRVRETALDAYAHQDLPFEQLVEELQPPRDLSHHPLFQVSFAVQNAPREEIRLPGLVVQALPPDYLATRFDLELYLWEEERELHGVVVYNADLFETTTVRRLSHHFETLLRSATAAPESRLDALAMLSPAERHQLGHEWQGTPRPPLARALLHEIFERRVDLDPEAVALEWDGGAWTFQDLDARANRLARHLRRSGVGPETVVALYLERSPELVAGVLAVLKAGGAYLPLERGTPTRRLATLLDDAGAVTVLTREELAGDLPRVHATVVRVDAVGEHPPERLSALARAENAAYVLYTSGSTGRPKGVVVPHGAAVGYLTWAIAAYGVDRAKSGAPLHSSLSFDLSLTSLFAPLLAGCRVALLPEADHLEALSELLRGAGGEALVKLTPAHLEVLRPGLEITEVEGPGVLVVGGEALTAESLGVWRRKSPATRLVNEYGPTEAVVGCVFYEVAPADPEAGPVPIGRPIAGARIHLADDDLRPVPAGTPGEVLVGGPGLARGYLGRPRRSAASFVPDPWSAVPGARLYKTGDLARHRRDGVLQYLGRADHQIKVRGYRVEPGEVEAVLGEHPTVRDVAVLAVDGARLAACVVPNLPQDSRESWRREQIEQWRGLYDELYGASDAAAEATFDTVGWNSSYTGQPLPSGEMREWLATTVERIGKLQPRRVLEIGCGTGMILHRVAPRSEAYVGTDLSRASIERLREQLASGEEAHRVHLLERPAHDFSGLAAGSFDTVVLNSVVQYFPGADYLAEVLEGAVEVAAPGGAVFVGDVRSLPLHTAFCAAVELRQAAPSTAIELLRERIRFRRLREQELLVDPAFFLSLQRRLPRITRVRVQPKLGRALNELTQFRYDVVLHLDGEGGNGNPALRIDWGRDVPSLDALRRTLQERFPAPFVLTRIPNRRLARENRLVELLGNGWEGAGALRVVEDLGRLAPAGDGVGPDELVELAREAGYDAELSWLEARSDGSFDVFLSERDGDAAPWTPAPAHSAPQDGRPLAAYGNDPLRRRAVRELVPRWNAYLSERLPEHMVPSTLVVVEELPLLPSGKVDRRALRRWAAEGERAEPEESFVAPRTAMEEALAAIWAEVLGLRRIGIHDDFFRLGGHSLLATQVASRVAQSLDVEVALRVLFERTTVAELALELERQDGVAAPPPIERQERDGKVPLSFAQQRLWFLDQLEPGQTAYNMPSAFRLEGSLDAGALWQALAEVTRRHEVLRTVFPSAGGEPRQQVRGEVPTPALVNLNRLPPERRAEEARILTEREGGRSFDLARGPLLRVALLRLAGREHVLLLVVHHILFDGWSEGVFHRELAALYEAFSRRRPSSLAEPPIQYADYSIWQRRWLQGETLRARLAYWRSRLAGTTRLVLPTDRPRPAVATFRGAMCDLVVPPSLAGRLSELSHGEGATLFMTLLAAFWVLLHRLSGQTDVSVGTPSAGRTRLQTEGLIGFFVNTLVLRGDLSGDPSFHEVLRRARETALGAQAHQDLPFEKLVEDLQPERDLGTNPFFQVFFNMVNVPDSSLELAGLVVERLAMATEDSKFDLTLYVQESGPGLGFWLVYNADLFDEARAREMLEQLALLLRQVAEDPARRISSHSLVSAGAAARLPRPSEPLVETWEPATLHAGVSRQAERIALVDAARCWTYGELEARSDRLARRLLAEGVRPRDTVAVFAHRSAPLVGAVLGILKAGAAYTILDPGYPPERLASYVRHSRPRGWIALAAAGAVPRELREALAGCACHLTWPDSSEEESTAPVVPVSPEDPAYVAFTSASTGAPRGVVGTHAPPAHFLSWYVRTFAVSEDDRFSALSGLGHDPLLRDLFAPLWLGATLFFPRPEELASPGDLLSWMYRNEITVCHLTPALARFLGASEPAQGLPALRYAFFGGDLLTGYEVSVLRKLASGVVCVNLYGTTETPQAMSCEVLPAEPRPRSWRVPLGRGIDGVDLLVLTAASLLAGIGEPGEIHVRSRHLARGYLDDERPGGERFLPNPFSDEEGDRVYRTGDLGRYLPDGRVEFLGRADRQVSVRGFRVEPNEIEELLRRHPEVREAVVVPRPSPEGESRLVAYLEARGEPPAVSLLRNHLRRFLPEPMIPAAFVRIEALPLTPNGKIDLLALPEADVTPEDLREAFVAPRTAEEEILAEIWRDVLHLERLGVEDNFFHVGGDSILSIRIVARAREQGLALTPMELFQHPTVAALARVARVEAPAPVTGEARRFSLSGLTQEQLDDLLGGDDVEDVYPLAPLQEGLLFHALRDPGSAAYFQQLSWTLQGPLDVAAFRDAWNRLVDRHGSLRTRFVWEGLERPLQIVERRAELPWMELDWRRVSPEEYEARFEELGAADRRRGFDLRRAPLMRLHLVRLTDEVTRVLWSHHHLLSDGWSLPVLLGELFTLYAGGRPETPAHPYRDYVAWLAARDLREAEGFWRRTLAGFTQPTLLGAAAPDGRAQKRLFGSLPDGASAALQAFGRRHHLTGNTMALGAWALLLSCHAGRDDVVFGTTVSGRPPSLPGAESRVGLFINTLPFRVRLPPGESVSAWLRRLQEDHLALRQHEHSPLASVRRWSEVPPPRELFDHVLVYQNYPFDKGWDPGAGLEITDVRSFEQTSFPLSISIAPGRELRFDVGYDPSGFEPDAVRRLLRQLGTLLTGLAAERRVGELSSLDDAARHQVVVEWNDTAAPLGRLTIHELFSDRCREAPDAPAVLSPATGTTLTYLQLDRRANRLARHLAARGAGPEGRVGLLLERSPEALVAMLGILKAGGAYVPLDPAYPRERLELMLEDAGVRLLVTSEETLASTPLDLPAGLEAVLLDAHREAIESLSGDEPASPPPPRSAAYVIYTSGSTGRPKGVVVEQRSLAWYAQAATGHYALSSRDRVLQVASISFDISVGEVFAPLAAGAAVVLLETLDSVPDLYRLCRETGVTVLFPSTALWHELASAAAAAPEEVPASLRLVSFGGERVLPERVEDWRRTLGRRIRLTNGYGPTEGTVESTLYEVREPPSADVPVGRPVARTRTYVLDRRLRPVPPGVRGELCVAGDGVARGYLGRPARTAEKFVPHAYAKDPGGRLYRTGDLASLRPDGCVELLGRLDQQVKVRGFRVEPGEVEAALAALPAIREAAVVARERAGNPGHHQLNAFLVAEDAEEVPSVRELRERLRARLPEHMMPAAFSFLEALPKNPNGKIDRSALRLARPVEPAPGDALRSPVEKALAEIWKRLLRLERLSRDDNFFELGGDSILALRIVAQAHRQGLRLSPRDLFEHQTVAELARTVGTVAERRGEQGPVTGPAPLLPIQRWFFEQHGASEPWHFNWSTLYLTRERLDPGLLRRAVGHLVRHHDALRSRFRGEGPSWSLRLAPCGDDVPFAHLDLSRLAPAEAESAARKEAGALQSRLDLENGPLLRLVFFDAASLRSDRLLLVVHHLVVDEVSWSLLLEDLATAYQELRAGKAVALPPKTTSLKEWANRLTEQASSEETQGELSFWLGFDRGVSRLDTDFDNGRNTVATSDTVTVSLDAEKTRQLLREVSPAYRTRINDVLLTAVARSFRRFSGSDSLLVDLEGHGREDLFPDVDLSRTVGWFTSVFPVLLELPSAGGEGASLMAVKEQLRAVPRHGIGFGLLRYVAAEAAGRLPQAEVSFNYLGQRDAATASFLEPTGDAVGPLQSPGALRSHLLEINGAVVGERLRMTWTYGRELHRRSTVERLARGFIEELEALIEHCLSPQAGGYTPSDFPLAGLEEPTLDRLFPNGGVEDVYPAVPTQEAMLWYYLYAPTSRANFEETMIRIEGDLDVEVLRESWRRLAERHAVLRTELCWKEVPRPLQVVRRDVEVPLRREDWRDVPRGPQIERLDAVRYQERRRDLRLDRAPLYRLRLIRLADREHALVWTIHHVLLDGWSSPLLLRDLAEIYRSLARGREPRLDPTPSFRCYVEWLARQDPAPSRDFWRRCLRGFTRPTPLPFDRAPDRSATGSEETHAVVRSIPADVAEDLRGLAHGHHLTLSTLVQGAWALALGRYGGEDDVVFGATTSGRPPELPGVESMVGLCINTLPVRARIAPRQALGGWLQDLQSWNADMRQHGYVRYHELQEWSEVPPGEVLFHSIMVFQNYPVLPPEANAPGDVRFQSLGTVEQTSFPLLLMAAASPSGLDLSLAYDERLFDATTVARFFGSFHTALAAFAADPDRQLGEMPLLSAGQVHQLIVEGNDTAATLTTGLPALFAAQVERTPEKIAVVSGERRMSYFELDRRSDQLALHLRSLGVGVEELVGLFVERSPELVVAVWGILKAGAAYVPLDPLHPRERLADVLEQARVRVVLTQESLAPELPGASLRRLRLDTDWPAVAARAGGVIPAEAPAERPAYVIFTSGSTGRPKGIVVTQRSLAAYAETAAEALGLVAHDRVLQFASISFDTSAEEIFSSLIRGATLVLRNEEMLESPAAFLESCRRWRITVLDLPTAYWHQLVSAMETEYLSLPPALRRVVIGGEKASDDRLATWRHQAGSRIRLLNTYGPTEATVVATTRELGDQAASAASLGRPIRGVRAYVLDRDLRPVPLGGRGELYLAGRGLVRGYLHRADLTAERFLPDSFAREPGGRLYATGDEVRLTAGGEPEFLGRGDLQVKLRGQRIALEEIEHCLASHPAVAESAVVFRDGDPQEALAAYLVARGEELQVQVLRSFLRKALPHYMIPSSFVTLESLPKTTSGKIDREALRRRPPPASDSGRIFATAELATPRDAVEKGLAEIFSETFDGRQVGLGDEFFALGGHSLLAVRLMAGIERRFGVHLPLAALFEEPSLEELAGLLRERRQPGPSSPRVAIRPSGSRPPFFCVHGAGGNVLCYRDLARCLSPEQPFFGLQARGIVPGEAFLDSIADMAVDYLRAVREAVPRGPYLLGGWSMGGLIAYEMARLLRSRGQEVGLLVLLDCAAPRPSSPETAVEAPLEPEPTNKTHLHQLFRNNVRSMLEYRPLPYPGVLTLIRAQASAAAGEADPTWGWGELAAGGVEVQTTPGDHDSMIRGPNARRLASVLTALLDRIREGGKGT